MVELFCAIVGEGGNVFEVDIAEDASMSKLKGVIKEKRKKALDGVDPDDLELFLAKTEEAGMWLGLDEDGAASVALDEKGHAQYSNKKLVGMGSLKRINKCVGMLPDQDQVHVLVKVPEQGTSDLTVSRHGVSQHGVFDRCSDPFFSQIPTVDQRGDWLEFPSLLPLTECPKLYIRSSYESIAEQALAKADPNRRKYAVITGTPGIGKSVFVYYVMWRLIKDKKRVLFFSKKGPIYFDGSTMYQSQSLPSTFNQDFWSPELWCLVDSVDPTAMPALPVEDCSVLLASTPRRDCIGEFKKLAPTPAVFYMPVWSKEELAIIAPLYPHAAVTWQNRFEYLGGVPRLVLQDIGTDPQAVLESACSRCSLDECVMLVSVNSEIHPNTKIAQTLIHIQSEEPYRDYKVAYASESAMHVVARTKWQSDPAKLQNLLNSCDGNPLAQSLCGYIFEPYCMDLLQRGGNFMYRELLPGTDKRMHDAMKRKRVNPVNDDFINIPPSQFRQIVERVEDGQQANQLYVPRAANYTAIDAWMPEFGGFQMTVGKKHTIKGGAANDLAKLGPNGNRLFFLLTPDNYDGFTKKTPQTIEQYALCIPYPKQVQ